MSGFDPKGRPIQTRQPEEQPTYPGNQGGTNWYSPSFSPQTGLFYLSIWDNYRSAYRELKPDHRPGQFYGGGVPRPVGPVPNAPAVPTLRRGAINNWTEAAGYRGIIAIDPHTGNREWTYTMTDVTHSGILTTDSIVGREGYFQALDARNGRLLWNSNLGGQMAAGPIPYEVDGNQYVVIASGHAPFAFAFGD